MSITISDVPPWKQYVVGDITIKLFTIPFAFYSNTDLLIYRRATGSSPDDPSDLLTLTTDYTVTGAGLASGATFTLTANVTLVAGDIITCVRDLPEARSNLYVPGGNFTATAVNDDFTKLVMMNQQTDYVANSLAPRYANSATLGAGDLLLAKLPALYSWRMNAAGTGIESFLAGTGGSTPVLGDMTVAINQAAHGLSVGNVVRCGASNVYVASQADTPDNAEVCGFVAVVTDADNFTMLLGGLITTGLAGLVAGSIMYLDPDVAGGLVSVAADLPGQVAKPILQVTTSTTGIWLNYLGVIL